VSSAAQLKKALSAAKPGDVITLAAGAYQGNFVGTAVGSAAQPIWLCGSSASILDGKTTARGYVLHLDKASYWNLVGFAVRDGQKGVVADGASHNIIDGLSVSGIGDEGVHLRGGSSYNTVQNNSISNTGLLKSKYGEGIYVGSARSNWCKISNCQPDRSDHNTIKKNTISNTTAENVDIKEGTTGGYLVGNSFNGLGMIHSGADSWVDVKGNSWVIDGNTGVNSVDDGFQTHQILNGWGENNTFRNNKAVVNGPGYGFDLTPALNNVVECNNVVTGAARGASNIACTGG
jgi:parallel beta-helix repeat protein